MVIKNLYFSIILTIMINKSQENYNQILKFNSSFPIAFNLNNEKNFNNL